MATVGCRKVSRARFTFISCWDRFGDVNNDPREKIGLFAKKRRAVPGGGMEKLDVSRQAVTKWETGTSRPSIENLQSLSRLYNVPLEYLLDESRDELPAPAPAAPAAEKGPEQTVQKKEKQWIRPLMIGAVVLALLVCFLFWYGRGQKENELDLHSIQGEVHTSSEVPKFNLDWE